MATSTRPPSAQRPPRAPAKKAGRAAQADLVLTPTPTRKALPKVAAKVAAKQSLRRSPKASPKPPEPPKPPRLPKPATAPTAKVSVAETTAKAAAHAQSAKSAAAPKPTAKRPRATPVPAAVAVMPVVAMPSAPATPAPRPAAKQSRAKAVSQPVAPPAAALPPAPMPTSAGPAAKRPRASRASKPSPVTEARPAETAPKARPKTRPARKATPATPPVTPPVAPPVTPPTGPAHSALTLVDGDQRRVAWRAGHACPPSLLAAAQTLTDAQGMLTPDDEDAGCTRLLELAKDHGHRLDLDAAMWPHLAAGRDMRRRLGVLELAYPDGPASPGLADLLALPLAPHQTEGALWSVVAGRALLADEGGLGKGVQAIAAAALWRRHFGLRRVLVLCAPAQRAAWVRAWARFARLQAQVMDGPAHERAAQWRQEAELRILSPEALAGDAAHLLDWAPELVIVDEPQLLNLGPEDWAALQSPQAMVLCGAALDAQPELLNTLIEWLDRARLGPLAALREVQAARAGQNLAPSQAALSEAHVERLDGQLSRLLLQRQRSEVAEQLPPRVACARLLPLGLAQRQVHDRALGQARRLLAEIK